MAVRFDAASDRLTHDGAYPQLSAGITITAWVRLEADQNAVTTFARLFDAGTLVSFTTVSDGTSGPRHATGGGTPAFADDMGALGVWVPIATTRAGGTASVYRRVGGTAATSTASGSITGLTGTPTGICLGGRAAGDAAEWLNGSLAYVRIWSVELTQAEVEAEWGSSVPIRAANLHSDWPLASATDLTDTVGGRTLTVQSGGSIATAAGPPIPWVAMPPPQPYTARRQAATF